MSVAKLALALALLGCSGSETPATTTTTTTTTGPAAAAPDPKAERERAAVAKLYGTTPPEWRVERWLNSQPRSLASLRGSVALVRFWTAGCPYCSTSAPALRKFHSELGPRGLTVIGVYHHKEDTPFDPAVYEETAKKYGFTFPLTFDPDWRTLGSWMRDAGGNAVETGWTSVTFLLDKQGVIRHVHPGGQYVEGDPAHAELEQKIAQLLQD
jgi:peroxiredoxin